MNAFALPRNTELDQDAVWQARVDLATCCRGAARLRLHARLGPHAEVCNHLSAMVPGPDDLFLAIPDGWSFCEITVSRLLICDFHRRVVAGEGAPEDTAFFIHARIHALVPQVQAAFHTYMPYATALTMVEGQPLVWPGQSSLKFYGRTSVDHAYNGLALDEAEGDHIAGALGDADILFMKHHGVLVTAPSTAQAWDDLHYLEWGCAVQCLAQATGRALQLIPPEIAARTAKRMRRTGERNSSALHLESLKRQLDAEAPEYRQ